jgi:hypothetical protein
MNPNIAIDPLLVLLLRHADIDVLSATDPPLSAKGQLRAGEFIAVVACFTSKFRRLRGIYATEAKRTQETVKPLSVATGILITVLEAQKNRTLRDSILSHHEGVVVVAVATIQSQL